MPKTIKFYHKNVYGNLTRYVSDPKQREAVQALTGQKTLTNSAIAGLQALGFEFEVVPQPVEDQ